MTMKTETPKTESKPRRTRRSSIPISEAARVELHHVADVLSAKPKDVAEAASEIASTAILGQLRTRLGRGRLEAARDELKRLEAELRVAVGQEGGAQP
jgi:hypothetical protein